MLVDPSGLCAEAHGGYYYCTNPNCPILIAYKESIESMKIWKYFRTSISTQGPEKGNPANINQVDKRLLERLAIMGQAYNLDHITISEGFRPWEQQNHFYQGWIQRKDGFYPANPPGYSWHEYGGAVDIACWDLQVLSNADFEKYGLCRPATGEDWHIQLIENNYSSSVDPAVGKTYYESITFWRK